MAAFYGFYGVRRALWRALLALAGSCLISSAEEPFVRGDANQDGALDVADPVFILIHHLFSPVGENLLCLDALDADDSGEIDLSDPIYLLRFLFLRGPPPPFPFPGCGPDPTEDRNHLDCPNFRTCPLIVNSIGMRLVYIQPGSFQMGSPEKELDRFPDETLHLVTLACGFYMGETEVTQEQYKKVMGVNPSYHDQKLDLWEELKNRPVNQVSWHDADQFCRVLSRKEGQTYRLPTEAEWEYACRAGTSTRFWFGDAECPGYLRQEYTGVTFTCDVESCEEAEPFMWWFKFPWGQEMMPVALKKPNPWGLYDMHGNVDEWCRDWYASYPRIPVVDPVGPPTGQDKILRGDGICFSEARSAFRGHREPSTPSLSWGFRVVLPTSCGLTPTKR